MQTRLVVSQAGYVSKFISFNFFIRVLEVLLGKFCFDLEKKKQYLEITRYSSYGELNKIISIHSYMLFNYLLTIYGSG